MRRLRHHKAQVLMLLLSVLCFISGVLTLIAALIIFGGTQVVMPARWIWFCLSYFVAGGVFLLTTRLLKAQSPSQEYSFRKRK